MKITLISGSHRKTSESARIGHYLEKQLQQNQGAQTNFLNLADHPLPVWDDGFWRGEDPWTAAWAPISGQLKFSDGFVIIAAEWNGTVPAALKNFFHYTNADEMGHKPGLIVSVSGGGNGAYPVAELKMASTKNNKMVYVPDHLIVRNAAKVLHDDTTQNNEGDDAYIRERIDFSLKVFADYAKALKHVRDAGNWQSDKFKFGA